MSATPVFGIPEIQSQQEQPEITHNEALILLQILMSGAEGRQNAPPGSPAEGEVYIVGDTPTGSWAGRPESIAIYYGSSWRFLPGADDAGTPIVMGADQTGIRVYRKDLEVMTVFDGTDWVNLTTELSNLTALGIGTPANPAIPFSATLNAALWDAVTVGNGGDGNVIIKMNKEATGDDALLEFETAGSCRGRIGLAGDDNLTLSGSSDGVTYADVLTITPTGRLGVNTDNPSDAITLKNQGDQKTRMLVENDRTTSEGQAQLQCKSDAANFFILSHGSGISLSRWGVTLAGWNEFLPFTGNGLAFGTFAADPVILGTNSTMRIYMAPDGKLGFHTSTPTVDFDIDKDTIRLRQSRTPASASDTGDTGEICWDADYVYVCVATDTWKRSALSTW